VIQPGSPLAPWVFGAALVLLLAGMAANAIYKNRREYARFKKLRSTKRRQKVMRRWLIQSLSLYGGASLISLLLAWQFVPLLLADINEWPPVVSARTAFDGGAPASIWITVAIVTVIVGGSVAVLFLARPDDGEDAPEIAALGDVRALLPRNRQELRYGAALSINAGVVEELLFRLGMPALIFGITGNSLAAVAGSLLVFGMLHAYQGVAGVLVSMLIGAVLFAIYVATGSILAAIVAHAFFDLRSLVLIPWIVLGVHKKPGARSASTQSQKT
jgi:membrane protease YdiL (CAAX protease family)